MQNSTHTLREKIVDSQVFTRVCRREGLTLAWQRVFENAGAAGGDGVTVETFRRGVVERIARLSDELASGRYAPGPIRRVMIPKRGGGERPLDIPCVVDRVAQTSVFQVLGPLLDREFEPSSFAYRAGRSVQQAVRRVEALRNQGFGFVVDADIRRYFENVPHEKLLDRLARSLTQGPLTELIALWLVHAAPAGRGLPQGSPLSPLLANLYLDDLDEAFAAQGARIVRYADDFVILCRSPKGAAEALETTARLLARAGLELHPEKTRITDFDAGFRFLGQAFVRSFAFPDPENKLGDAISDMRALAEADRQAEERAEAETGERTRRREAGHDPGQRILYVLQPRRRLDARPNGFAVQENFPGSDAAVGRDGGWRDLLLLQGERVDRIEIGTAADVTRPALAEAFATDTPIAFVNGHGQTLGWAGPALAPRAGRQLAQAACALDAGRRLALARHFVEGRLRTERAMLHRLNRERRLPQIVRALAQMQMLVRKAPHAASLGELLGIEGAAGKLYWRSLSLCLPEGLRLRVRERPAAEEPVNILFNAAASFLLRDCACAMQRAGLNPGFGMLHATGDHRDAGAYDLAEEFRAALAEGPVLAAVNRGAISHGMFVRLPDGRWHATSAAMGALVRAREQAAERLVGDSRSGRRRSWRATITDQALRLAAHFETGAQYRPVTMDY